MKNEKVQWESKSTDEITTNRTFTKILKFNHKTSDRQYYKK